ncbi:metallopeptidase family protein [Aurantimonas sp. Leaf443]|uniref:metallopeptidase family protein n=1 Tax=Aurantimonas sp. Leaf443 TaxID=1736378 RepID=UPI0006F878EC|nr:metallopeptidase family protein [Aurantimonas sp. Leaf443]KQT85476.1 Zn-dependent protease [Aurantimonas sp. Leaf443]
MSEVTSDGEEWKGRYSPDLAAIESIAMEAYAALPETFRALAGDIRFHVADFPEDDVIAEMELESAFDILGLFEGRPVAAMATPVTGEFPNRILLYRRPILDYWAENEETLDDLVTHVLVHEIGHHFGLSDEDMEELEAQVRD